MAIIRLKDAVINTDGYAAFSVDEVEHKSGNQCFLGGHPWGGEHSSAIMLSGPLTEDEATAALDTIYKAMDAECWRG